MKRNRGFTIIELMVTVVILGIITTMAAPSFSRLIQRAQIDADVSVIQKAFSYARGYAVNQRIPVTVCSSTDAATCNGSGDWTAGWIAFTDKLTRGSLDSGDEILRVWQNVLAAESATLIEQSSTQVTAITFDSDGRVDGQVDLLLFPNSQCGENDARLISVRTIGRATVTVRDCS